MCSEVQSYHQDGKPSSAQAGMVLEKLRIIHLVLEANIRLANSQFKRSLKLDDQFEENSFSPSKVMRKKRITAYSPTTGTYQLSPIPSPTTPKEQEHRNGPSNGTRKQSNLSTAVRQESTVKGSDGFMMLLSKIERSSEKTMEIMKNLSSIQALEGNRQLEDLIGVSLVPCSLKSEAKKTKELMTKVIKQKLLEKKNSGIPPKVLLESDNCADPPGY
ncbi:Centromere protein R [Apodemus speciosus]|uniref:Centromere protein R n=1 Tax=Apodemus speciosus TaxID=105296 RepID=A0ABQ0ENP9_APOSI